MALVIREFELESSWLIEGGWFLVPVGDMAIFEAVSVQDPLGVIGDMELLRPDDVLLHSGGLQVRLGDEYVGRKLSVYGAWRD